MYFIGARMSSPVPENESINSPSSSSETRIVEPIRLPTVEEVRGQDIWNNCAVRSVTSGVMGMCYFFVCCVIL